MVVEDPHTLFWSAPAFGGIMELIFIVTRSAVAHDPLVTFHSYTYDWDVAPVTTAVGDVAGVNVGVLVPTILVQLAVPGDGKFAALVHPVTLHKFWSGPALAAGNGIADITTFRSSDVEQPAVAIEYLKV